MGRNPNRGVCPWCTNSEVAEATVNGYSGCQECLYHLRVVFARCSCGTIVQPDMGLYEVRKDGTVTCCFCLGSVRCQVSSCGGCDACMDWDG